MQEIAGDCGRLWEIAIWGPIVQSDPLACALVLYRTVMRTPTMRAGIDSVICQDRMSLHVPITSQIRKVAQN